MYQLFALLGTYGRERGHPQVAVHAHPRGGTDLDVQVGCPLFDDVTQYCREVDHHDPYRQVSVVP